MTKWIELLLDNFSAVINHCGNMSERFSIGRGARQGDPIASYIFILSIEILAHKLRNDRQVKGFKFKNKFTHVLELYADDCSIFLEPSEETLRAVIVILEEFRTLSGLKISMSKTKAVWFGCGCENKVSLCPDLNLDWSSTFRLLGVDFRNNLKGMETNFESKIEEIKALFYNWMNRNLSIYGKIIVVKSLNLSKLSPIWLKIKLSNWKH